MCANHPGPYLGGRRPAATCAYLAQRGFAAFTYRILASASLGLLYRALYFEQQTVERHAHTVLVRLDRL